MKEWFVAAHDTILRAFEGIMSERAKTELWAKHD
jgi:hypothetical protein